MGTELETPPVVEGEQKPAGEGEQKKPEDIPKLDPNMKIQLEDGTSVVLGEAIKSHLAAQSAPAPIDPERMKSFELYEKAKEGDPAALRSIMESSLPVEPDEVVDPKSEQGQILSLQKQVGELQQAAEQTGRVSKDIVDAANAQRASVLIAEKKKDFPWLAHHPAGAHKLVSRLNDLNALAQQSNVDPTKPDVAQRIHLAAFQSLNGEIKTEMNSFGVTEESIAALTEQVKQTDAQQKKINATGIVDDQKRGGRMVIDEHGIMNEDFDDGRHFGSDALDSDIPAIRSRFAITPLGAMYERSTAQLMANAQGLQSGQTAPLRSEDLQGTAEGRRNFADQGRMSVRGLREQLRARQEEIG